MLEAFLVYVNEVVFYVCLHPINVLAPLAQPLHLERHVGVLLAFGLDNENPLSRQLDQKVRVVVGDVAVRVHVVQLEMHRQIIFGVGNHVVAVFQKAGKQQLKMAVANDPIKDALFRDEVALILERWNVATYNVQTCKRANVLTNFRPQILECKCRCTPSSTVPMHTRRLDTV